MQPTGRGGPEWGAASEELNATVLAWPPGGGTPEHVNVERDVAVVVVAGSLELTLDGAEQTLRAGEAAIVPKGVRRTLTAGADGVRYATVHRKRAGLMPTRIARPR